MHQSHPLPPALLGDQSNLSDHAKEQIRALVGARPIAFLAQAAGAWAVIIGAIALAVHIGQLWMTLLAIVLVGTRLNVLGLLVHEQVHFLGLKGRYGDLIANLLVGYPLLALTVEGYAAVHLAHHRFFFTARDPDFLRKSGVDWDFPMTPKHLAKLFLGDLFGLSFIKLIRGKRLDKQDGRGGEAGTKPSETAELFKRPYPTPAWVRPAYYVVVASGLTYAGLWPVFLIYWLIPLLTVLPVIVRLGAITEHVYDLPGASVIDASPLVMQTWWEKLILPNLNFSLHPYHHFYTGVAYLNLPKVHQIFVRENLVNERNVFHGYWDYLKYLQRPQPELSAAPGNL